MLRKLDNGVHLHSVLITDHEQPPRHLYRLVGGPEHGRTFTTLRELAAYVRPDVSGPFPTPTQDGQAQ